jgi:hypothetical protein
MHLLGATGRNFSDEKLLQFPILIAICDEMKNPKLSLSE